MDNFSYHSYPDSGNSSPPSFDCDNNTGSNNPPSSAWADGAAQPNYKVKFLCSYGGKIQPRPRDNHLSYTGGDTKIFSVDRSIKYAALISKLSSVCNSSASDICFKYQLPGEELDALISVTNDEDVENMMSEYDRLNRSPSKPPRVRIFVFNRSLNANRSDDRYDTKPEGKWFVDALNSAELGVPSSPLPSDNADFLFGSDNGPNTKASDSDSVKGGEAAVPIQKLEDEDPRVYQTEFYDFQDKFAPPPPQSSIPVSMSAAYWPERQPAPMYILPTAATGSMYHHQNPVLTGAPGPAYYNISQRFIPELYRDQPVYGANYAPPQTVIQQPSLTAFEGIGVMGQSSAVSTEQGFAQMSCDSSGRPVYYTVSTGGLAPPYQMPIAAAAGAVESRAAGGFSQEGKAAAAVGKVSHTSSV